MDDVAAAAVAYRPDREAALAAQADAVAAGVWKTEARFAGRGEDGDIRRAVQDMTAVDPHAEGHQRGSAQPATPTNRATMQPMPKNHTRERALAQWAM